MVDILRHQAALSGHGGDRSHVGVLYTCGNASSSMSSLRYVGRHHRLVLRAAGSEETGQQIQSQVTAADAADVLNLPYESDIRTFSGGSTAGNATGSTMPNTNSPVGSGASSVLLP